MESMKYFVLLVSIIVLFWGLWVVIDERGTKQALATIEACEQLTDNQTWARCNGSAWSSARELETRAYWAIGLGGLFGVLSGRKIWAQTKQRTEASKRNL